MVLKLAKPSLSFKWRGFNVEVYSMDEKGLEDLAFCARLSRKNPLWHEGLVVCACSDILDARTVSLAFLKEGRVLMEQVCYAALPNYRRVVKVKGEDVMVSSPIIRAYGIFKELASRLMEAGKT
ncbi:MAG: hypothetical protein QXK12_00730 [Candidatus Nezhaarchaeales archaeon]